MAQMCDLTLLREEYWHQHDRYGLTIGDVAERMGVSRDRVACLTGQKRDARCVKDQAVCTEATAVRFCEALHVYPFDVGI